MRWEDVYEPLLNCGFATSERELSIKLGGNPSLISTSKARSREVSADCLINLIRELDRIEKEIDDLVLGGTKLTEHQRFLGRTAFLLRHQILDSIRGDKPDIAEGDDHE